MCKKKTDLHVRLDKPPAFSMSNVVLHIGEKNVGMTHFSLDIRGVRYYDERCKTDNPSKKS